ncbi:hypothetical protein SDC9_171701 [bioreactor metagenome]|uniref:Uncharacterized protein n=1 Tax=bioreactor metagenome TaxID=1076179 RepID=A0A645GCB3_9ZZZZ
MFESIFSFAAEKKGFNISGFSLSKVTRFYETGVRSAFGEELAEFGFPTNTIREIEKHFPQLLDFDIGQSKTFYFQNKGNVYTLLDSYEKHLIQQAVESMLRN